MDSHLTMMVPRCLSSGHNGDDVNEYTLSTGSFDISNCHFCR